MRPGLDVVLRAQIAAQLVAVIVFVAHDLDVVRLPVALLHAGVNERGAPAQRPGVHATTERVVQAEVEDVAALHRAQQPGQREWAVAQRRVEVAQPVGLRVAQHLQLVVQDRPPIANTVGIVVDNDPALLVAHPPLAEDDAVGHALPDLDVR